MTERHHLLVHGGTFAAVGDGGDISGVRGGGSPDGLFVRDARHLSRWQLTVDGAVPEAGERRRDRLALRVEHARLGVDPDFDFHAR